MERWRDQTHYQLHWAKRRYTACQHGPKTGVSCRQMEPEAAVAQLLSEELGNLFGDGVGPGEGKATTGNHTDSDGRP